jgi:hypothetical protein
MLVLSNTVGAGVNRMPSIGRIVQEANAAGKAGGYADVDTIT